MVTPGQHPVDLCGSGNAETAAAGRIPLAALTISGSITPVCAAYGVPTHTRDGIAARERVGPLAAVKVFRHVSKDRVLAVMIVLAGLGSFFIGAAMQTVMPTIIADTTTGSRTARPTACCCSPTASAACLAACCLRAPRCRSPGRSRSSAPRGKRGQVVGLYSTG
jgi:hypothetical protein